jgi:hypothetical protein
MLSTKHICCEEEIVRGWELPLDGRLWIGENDRSSGGQQEPSLPVTGARWRVAASSCIIGLRLIPVAVTYC